MQLTPASDDFDVRSNISEWGFPAELIELQGGRVLVVWHEYSGAGHSSGSGYVMHDVYARLYEADATPVGGAFRVNETDLSGQEDATVVALDDGGFLVAWQTWASGTTYLIPPVIVGRRFDADGVAQTGDFTLASAVGQSVEIPELTNLGNGTILLTYFEKQASPADPLFKGVLLNASGTPTGTPFTIGDANGWSQSVALLGDGNVLAAWAGTVSGDDNISARILSPTGAPVTGPIVVSDQGYAPDVAVLADGSAIIVWQEGYAGDYHDIYARRMAADGSLLGDAFKVETIDLGGDQSEPDVIALADGGFLIVWHTGNTWTDYDIRARRYDANGEPIDIETYVSSAPNGPDAFYPHGIELLDGRIAIFWEAYTWGSTSDMVMRIFEAQSFGTADGETITGDETANWIDGQAGDDVLLGAEGADMIYGSAGMDTIAGNAGDDTVMGGTEADTLYGGDDHDELHGDEGDDSVNGGRGNDLLLGGADNDELDGESGNDTIAGNDGNDTARGGLGNDRLFGGTGNDNLRGEDGADSVDGGSGADIIAGNDGDDTARGGTGDDRIFGGRDNDELHGEAGHDSINGGQGDDLLLGGEDRDTLDGESGNDTIAGNDGDDTARGGTGDDRLFGGRDNDDLRGEDGHDSVNGGSGNDLMTGGNDNDLLEGESGADTIAGNDGNDRLLGGDDGDRLFGGNDNDTVAGNDGDDYVHGGLGDDRVFGGAGRDTVVGGAGQDVLGGGGGTDVFVFLSVSDSPAGAVSDEITDFQTGIDKIDLSGIMPGLNFVASYTGTAGEVRYNDALGRLYIDVDGDRSSDFAVDLTPGAGLTEADLIL